MCAIMGIITLLLGFTSLLLMVVFDSWQWGFFMTYFLGLSILYSLERDA